MAQDNEVSIAPYKEDIEAALSTMEDVKDQHDDFFTALGKALIAAKQAVTYDEYVKCVKALSEVVDDLNDVREELDNELSILEEKQTEWAEAIREGEDDEDLGDDDLDNEEEDEDLLEAEDEDEDSDVSEDEDEEEDDNEGKGDK